MTINAYKSTALKKILKVGEDDLVTHKGDSNNPGLKWILIENSSNINFWHTRVTFIPFLAY
jgi:hypothetical protein